jgi:7,8-dihydro-6-hydroxymethylpterin dimethyltransferase
MFAETKLPDNPGAETRDRLLKKTKSRCPVCRAVCPAEVWLSIDTTPRVFLRRNCLTHGEASICIASDARFYWLARGKPENADNSPHTFSLNDRTSTCCQSASGCGVGTLGRNAVPAADGSFEKLSTCLALIEIVDSCNLSCPTCYADSPSGPVNAVPLNNLKARIEGVIQRKGGIEILQLSGGEPTLHPEFFQLLEWAQNHPGIDYLLINTNGVRLASDDEFMRQLGIAAQRRHLQLYLQFDGVQEAGQKFLRGADLRRIRERAIARAAEIQIPLTLAMTVTAQNLAFLWQAVEFGLQHSHIRGVCFQPLFGSGRLPSTDRRLNTADIILAAVEQSNGRLRFEDFTPLPCGDPNCATIGYLLKVNNRTYSISDFIDFTQVQGFLRDKVRYKLEDLIRCGCESQPLGQLLKQFEMDESNAFRLLIKPFMDAWTWDEDRIDRCCTHVIRPDGKLDSFCRYYSGFSDLRAAP